MSHNTPSNSEVVLDQQVEASAHAALIVKEGAYRRLLATILTNIELKPTLLDDGELSPEQLLRYELIVADEALARRLRPLITSQQAISIGIKPALIAIVDAPIACHLKELAATFSMQSSPCQRIRP